MYISANGKKYSAANARELANLKKGDVNATIFMRRGKSKKDHNRTVSFKDHNNDNGNNNSNSSSSSYTCLSRSHASKVFAVDVSATADSSELAELDAPVIKRFKINNYENKEEKDGKYIGTIDTGANIAAMQLKYAIHNQFPVYKLRRSINIDTANGEFICQYAVCVDIENDINPDDIYWMKTIFYLLDNIKTEIIIDRRTMRLMGLDISPSTLKYYHPSSNTGELARPMSISGIS